MGNLSSRWLPTGPQWNIDSAVDSQRSLESLPAAGEYEWLQDAGVCSRHGGHSSLKILEYLSDQTPRRASQFLHFRLSLSYFSQKPLLKLFLSYLFSFQLKTADPVFSSLFSPIHNKKFNNFEYNISSASVCWFRSKKSKLFCSYLMHRRKRLYCF